MTLLQRGSFKFLVCVNTWFTKMICKYVGISRIFTWSGFDDVEDFPPQLKWSQNGLAMQPVPKRGYRDKFVESLAHQKKRIRIIVADATQKWPSLLVQCREQCWIESRDALAQTSQHSIRKVSRGIELVPMSDVFISQEGPQSGSWPLLNMVDREVWLSPKCLEEGKLSWVRR
jgi:hypothetical protein